MSKEADRWLARGKRVNFWLDCEPEYIEVLLKIDVTNDPLWLLPYLNVPEAAKRHFADLFERKQFTLRKGPKGQRAVRRDPSYLISEKLVELPAAMAQYYSARYKGASVAEAKAAAREVCPSVTEKDIEDVVKGQHRAYREARFRPRRQSLGSVSQRQFRQEADR
jgi:hypothetical protein